MSFYNGILLFFYLTSFSLFLGYINGLFLPKNVQMPVNNILLQFHGVHRLPVSHMDSKVLLQILNCFIKYLFKYLLSICDNGNTLYICY